MKKKYSEKTPGILSKLLALVYWQLFQSLKAIERYDLAFAYLKQSYFLDSSRMIHEELSSLVERLQEKGSWPKHLPAYRTLIEYRPEVLKPWKIYNNETKNDRWLVEYIFPGKHDGFFIEAGAADGIEGSTCYVLETELGWTGICIEPNQFFFKNLVKNRPNSKHENLCLASQSGQVAYIEGNEETVNPFLGGITNNLRDYKWGGREVIQKGKEVTKPADTLANLLAKHNAPAIIDYAGFDIEGSEFEVLSSFPFDKYTFLTMTIECDEIVWQQLFPMIQVYGYLQIKNPFNQDMHWEKYLVHESIFT